MPNNSDPTSGYDPGKPVTPTKVVPPLAQEKVARSDQYSFLSPAIEEDELGRLGNYRVLELLGAGGMGMVFLAEDIALCRRVALKVMKPDADHGSGKAWQRFLREARSMAAIKHDNLVTVFQAGQEGDTIFLAMELLHGQSLEQWIENNEEPDVNEILRIGRDIGKGLVAIHEHNLIHRDIKPSNIWLETRKAPAKTESGRSSYRVKILDFGLARSSTEDTHLTRTGTVVGTPAFLSPEQARGKPADFRSDLFSFGCVLYCLGTRSVPFPAENTMAQLAALVADEPTPMREINPAIPEPLDELVMQMLAKNPDARPHSAAEVVERLQDIKKSLTGKKRKVSDTLRLPAKRTANKSRTVRLEPALVQSTPWKLIAAVGAVACLLLFGLIVWLMSSATPRDDRKKQPTPPLDVAKGDPVPPGVTFLNSLPTVNAVNWPFKGEKNADKGKKGKKPPPRLPETFSVQGKALPHAILMHPAPFFEDPASVGFRLDGNFRNFKTTASMNDSSPSTPAQMTFAVYADGKPLWKSTRISEQSHAQECNVDVTGVRVLKLEVTADGDIMGAHALWIDPQLTK